MIDNNNNRNIRCRFAPSPTGDLHVGGVRTALFNYLLARSRNGTFVLRIEDTDRERSTKEALDVILKGMEWLKLKPDEGPFFQSERSELYREYVKKLLMSGHAYRCTCTPERLAELRDKQRSENKTPRYDGLHRPKDFEPQPAELPTGNDPEPFVIRLRTPQTGVTSFTDLILGDVNTPNDELDDFILVRSDGSPTYNFVVVVDDIDMDMTHVIRGMDHVSNTPKQLVIYEALGASPPLFAHVPVILGPDKKKLSKRHGATSVVEYAKMGYLPDAFVNYTTRLGWSHGDQEVFLRDELESVFNLDSVGKSPAVFDQTKLEWVNAEHIKLTSPEKLRDFLKPFLKTAGVFDEALFSAPEFLVLIVNLKERSKTLVEMAASTGWYFTADEALEFEPKAAKKHLKPEAKPLLEALAKRLKTLESFDEASLSPEFEKLVEEQSIKLGALAQPVRVSLTGTAVSPPIYAVLEILGKERTLARLFRAIEFIGAE